MAPFPRPTYPNDIVSGALYRDAAGFALNDGVGAYEVDPNQFSWEVAAETVYELILGPFSYSSTKPGDVIEIQFRVSSASGYSDAFSYEFSCGTEPIYVDQLSRNFFVPAAVGSEVTASFAIRRAGGNGVVTLEYGFDSDPSIFAVRGIGQISDSFINSPPPLPEGIAIRGFTPGISYTSLQTVSMTLNGKRQPHAGDLLVIFHGNTLFNATAMVTPTVNGSTTGVTAVPSGSADAGLNSAHVKSYYYVVNTTGDVLVSTTETAQTEEKVLVAYVISGADTVNPIDGAAGAFSAASQTSQAAAAVSPASANALLLVHNNSGGVIVPTTYLSVPPEPFGKLYQNNADGKLIYVGGSEKLTASGTTGTRTFTAQTACPWAAVSIAVKSA